MATNFSDYFYYDETSPSCLRWKIDRRCGMDYNVLKVSADSMAGHINSAGYFMLSMDNEKILAHRVVFQLMHNVILPGVSSKIVIDHIDGDKKNNKVSNLRAVPQKENMRNLRKCVRNSSGVTGVSMALRRGGRDVYYVAQIMNLDYQLKSKLFSVKKHGLLPAFLMACNYRDKMIAELNEQGAGYSESHGK